MNAPVIEASPQKAMPTVPLLFIDSLSVSFGNQHVLRNVSLELTSGETLVILGESGCGKTVLLKTMIGLIKPSIGDVRFEDTSLASMTERQL
ncbi:MAG: ATP-binding cassette domain-containing protein, partial [Planctomycetaceae bacterium]|nr:ATP-binding cassette domain-containing protein [Planctomycetaceae bacterium]